MESAAESNPITRTMRFPPVKKVAVFSTFFFLLCMVTPLRAQTDYAVHANIIYHFTKYINWPADKKSGDFVIGIIGESSLYEKLGTYIANKYVGGQKIVIRKYAASAQYFDCHILFVCEDESRNLKKIASGTSTSPVLLVTESEGLARKGACINFVIVDDRLRLEINKKNIEQRSLGIATELLKLATVVK